MKPHRSRITALIIAIFALTSVVLIAPTLEARPRITSPKQSQKYGANNLTISWTGERGAKSYHLKIREYGASNYWVVESMTTSSYIFRPKQFDAIGRRFQVYVWTCAGANGTNCQDEYSQVSAYFYGPPVQLASPADNATHSNRKPTLHWQAYDGLHPSSGTGSVTYKVSFSGNGAPLQQFTTTSTTFTPTQDVNPAFQNPVRWTVTACKSYNCSGTTPPRRINLGGSSFDELTGTVSLYQPSNGTNVDVGSQLKWQKKDGVATYKICLNMYNSGCRLIRDQAAQSGTIQTYTLTASDLDLKPPFGDYYFRGKTMYWSIGGCNQGNTSCLSDLPEVRSVQVAPASTSGGSTGGGDPQVSFANHLYPTIASAACDSCHQSSSRNPPYYPQKTDGTTCSPNTIPFNTTATASSMLQRFKCIKARSQQGVYSQALGKVYVVPGNANNSGLHWKAQNSSASIFSQNVTIDGVQKPLKEWITIWINQGANP